MEWGEREVIWGVYVLTPSLHIQPNFISLLSLSFLLPNPPPRPDLPPTPPPPPINPRLPQLPIPPPSLPQLETANVGRRGTQSGGGAAGRGGGVGRAADLPVSGQEHALRLFQAGFRVAG